jgi:type VI secretion system protein ImpH
MSRELLAELVARAPRLDFFELVRLLEHALGTGVREAGAAACATRIAFTHTPDLAFAESDVTSLEMRGRTAHVATTFFGLLGTASPLSPEWSEEVLHNDDDGALQAFYDVFHDRSLSLLFAAWKAHSLEGGFDLQGDDDVSKRLRSLAGIDGWAEGHEEELPPMAAVGVADYQRGQPQTIDLRSAEGLLRRLHPDWNVRLSASLERFVPFTPAERTCLGTARTRLGEDFVYGDGMNETQALIRIGLGPVDKATYEGLMPGGPDYTRLERLTRQLFAASVDVEIEVELMPKDADVLVLGSRAGSRLGVDTRYSSDRGVPVRVRAQLLQNAARARREFV